MHQSPLVCVGGGRGGSKANLNEIIEDSNRIQAGAEFGQARVLFS